MSGHQGELSPSQEEALKQMKDAIADVWSDEFTDGYILQWLRARKFNVNKAEKMLRDHLEWRKTYQIDTILEAWNVPEVLSKYFPGGYAGFEFDGTPIWIDCIGRLDLKGMIYSASKKDILKYKARQNEYLLKVIHPQISKKLGHPMEQMSLIFDMEGIGMNHLWKPSLDTFTEIMKMYEANYPETMKTTYIVNAPKIFPILFNIVKPFLREETRDKIKMFGANWKEELVKYIDPEHLPVHWGGKATDPDGDPFCASKVCLGGPVPEEFNIPSMTENSNLQGFTTAVIARGSDLKLVIDVEKPGSILKWNFATDGMDITFGIRHNPISNKTNDMDKMETLVRPERINSHIVPEYGSITCDKSGSYIVLFDNSYSWLHAKKISYFLEVLDPNVCELVNEDSACTKI
ncbi:hypothetical protein CAPTEDRAFT_168514 [Capitella teleta]|uniref:CRAL-TRIO domain-containing protein n=1 Tax=Capitella teleta TaxID=283909 RepID=R7UNK7_CAPTE|nr:hypothetical protein CAPTEDRAFT_168514 [Capitella teleta]|eukprot:ELU07678.1 hypothetical protein CAPTEDRAFT_168514 [Capitella teleta]